jgi:hypothetical protein
MPQIVCHRLGGSLGIARADRGQDRAARCDHEVDLKPTVPQATQAPHSTRP